MTLANEVVRLVPFFAVVPGAIVALFVAGVVERRRRPW